MDQRPDVDLNAALVAFNEESIAYCQGINDEVSREYAMGYAEMIGQRLRGVDSEPPKIRHELFAPSRRWICATLEEMYEKYCPSGAGG